MTASIATGVPIPRKNNYRVGKVAGVIAQMSVGDSVIAHHVGVNYPAFQAYSDYHGLGMRFTSRKTKEGIRVWRVA